MRPFIRLKVCQVLLSLIDGLQIKSEWQTAPEFKLRSIQVQRYFGDPTYRAAVKTM